MKRFSFALLLLLILTAAKDAAADGPYDGYGCGCGYGYGYNYLYGSEHVPYFALHPPVYYSVPVPRTYGYSPFAYPPGVRTPEVSVPTPVTVINPFVPQESKKTKSISDKTTSVSPLMILNPYTTQNVASNPNSAE